MFDSWWHHFFKQSECSAVGSALRSGRRGRAFESPHSDRTKGNFCNSASYPFCFSSIRDEIETTHINSAQFENLGELVKMVIFAA